MVQIPARTNGRTRVRLLLAGVLGAAALTAGAGAAYAASAGSEVVETGYGTVVEAAAGDCPDRGAEQPTDPEAAR